MNSRNKGKRGELEARDAFRQHWAATDECIRAGQANGSYSADVLCALPDTHVEVKFIKRIAAIKYMRQAEKDAKPGELPIVAMRENGDTEFVIMVRLHDWPELARRLSRQVDG